MKKHVLSNSEPEAFGLIGITAPVKDYRICWLLNRHLEFDLTRSADVLLPKNKSNASPAGLFDQETESEGSEGFSCYEYEIEEDRQIFYLVANRNDFRFLVPELNRTDYFLIIQGPFSPAEAGEFQRKISAIPEVLNASVIDSSKLKSKNNLVF